MGRRISALEDSIVRFNELEDMVEQIEKEGVGSGGGPAKPCECAELNITTDDLIKWHEAHERSEEFLE